MPKRTQAPKSESPERGPSAKKAKRRHPERRIGTHVSIAGGFHKAVERAHGYGATSFAIFTQSRNKKQPVRLDEEAVRLWQEAMTRYGFEHRHVVPHGSYFVNLGSPKEDTRERSRGLFLEELKRCQTLGIPYLNIHPGSCKSGKNQIPLDESIGYIAESINWACQQVEGVMVLLENTAGGGSTIGRSFEEIKQIMDLITDPKWVGVCLDTCHLFAAGFDIRTQQGYEETMKQFDEVVGMEHLKAIHLNDTKDLLHSNKDRHVKIGDGGLGEDCFSAFMNDPRLKGVPMVLETPTMEHKWEIDYLHSLGGEYPEGGDDDWSTSSVEIVSGPEVLNSIEASTS